MPFPSDHTPLDSPAQRWGVSSSIPGALIAGLVPGAEGA
jgi:hypothetical protein